MCDYLLINVNYFIRSPIDPLLYTEHTVLKQKIVALENEVDRDAALRKENEQLRGMLDMQKKSALELIPAFVLWKDPTHWRRVLVIDRGKRKGVSQEMLVISESGALVGKVVECTDDFAYVMLLTDPSFKIIARIKNKPVEGVFRGALSGGGVLSYVTADAGVATDDQLYVSENSVYPSGFLIGSVQKMTTGRDILNVRVIVKTAAPVTTLQHVFVIKQVPDYLVPKDVNIK